MVQFFRPILHLLKSIQKDRTNLELRLIKYIKNHTSIRKQCVARVCCKTFSSRLFKAWNHFNLVFYRESRKIDEIFDGYCVKSYQIAYLTSAYFCILSLFMATNSLRHFCQVLNNNVGKQIFHWRKVMSMRNRILVSNIIFILFRANFMTSFMVTMW